MIVRGTVYYLRLRVPRHLETQIGRTHFTKSLGTGLKSEAVRRARIEAAEFERRLMAAEGHSITSPIPTTVIHASPTAVVKPERATAPEETFDDLFRLFLADPAKRRTRKAEMHYENLAAVVEGLWGLKAPLRSIDRDACRELLDTFRRLPSNSEKRFPKLSVVQAATMARDKKLTSILSPATVNGYMTKLRTLLNFALNEGWIDRNPARGLRVVDPVRRRDKRLPFTLDQLRLTFDAPLYRGCVDDWFGYAAPGTAQPRRGRFWVSLIALFSGMRLNEVCQLDVADVQQIEGVDCFFVSAGVAATDNDKRLKTISSERFIPVHPTLREIGFMQFMAERRHAGGKKLFPELQVSSTGYYSDPFSKWFRRFLGKAGAALPEQPASPRIQSTKLVTTALRCIRRGVTT